MKFDDLDAQMRIYENTVDYCVVPSEITWLLKSLGYKNIDIFGARLGAFSREHKLTTNDFEMLVIAETTNKLL